MVTTIESPTKLRVSTSSEIINGSETQVFNVNIPQSLKPGYYEVDGYELLLGENEYLKWAWLHIGHTKGVQICVFNDVPGSAPVSGLYTEWYEREPHIGNAYFYTYGVQRSPGAVRIFGTHSYGNPLECAFGYTAIKE